MVAICISIVALVIAIVAFTVAASDSPTSPPQPLKYRIATYTNGIVGSYTDIEQSDEVVNRGSGYYGSRRYIVAATPWESLPELLRRINTAAGIKLEVEPGTSEKLIVKKEA